MAIVFRYSDPRGAEENALTVDLGQSVVRYAGVGLSSSAEVGQAAVSGIEIDDPGGAYDFQGLRAFHVHETTAPAGNTIIFRGVIQNQTITRAASMRTVNDRRWSLDLSDYNYHLGKRVLTDADANRPAETAGDRIRWLLTSAAHFALNDYGHVVYPTNNLDAADYRGQRPGDLLTDCAIEQGYNFFCRFNEANGTPELFFFHPDSTTMWTSTVQISNDFGDVSLSQIAAGTNTVFLPYEDAQLVRDPTRIAYGVYFTYANGAVYVRKDQTGDQFAKQDQTASQTNIKSAARATRVATHFLNDNDEQDERITCSIIMPPARVNDLLEGQLLSAKFTHLPGWEDFRNCRALRRTVSQVEELGLLYYKVELELTPIGPDSAPPPDTSAPPTDSIPVGAVAWLYRADSISSADGSASKSVFFDGTGDNPTGGEANHPITNPPFSYINEGAHLSHSADGIASTGTGTIGSLRIGVGTSSVWGAGTVVTLHLQKNGSDFHTWSTGVMSGFANVSLGGTLTNVSITAGDQWTATLTRDSGSGSFRAGQPGHGSGLVNGMVFAK